MNETTIAAISTFPAESAIGILRLSGPDASAILSKIVSYKNPGVTVMSAEPRRTYLCSVGDGSMVFDEAMVTVFRAPHSYTGEDMSELSCHGNPFILSLLLNAMVSNGACPAAAGEFTRRAFLNGKIDLSQAEAVADIIGAKNEAALSLALKQLDGAEKTAIKKLKDSLTELITLLELEIDFAHEDTAKTTHEQASADLNRVIIQVRDMIASADEGIMIKEGVKTVITGKPNAGKSSLLNALLKKNRAIVTHIPGTTRDVIEDSLSIDGISFRLFDTAGIRGSDNLVELEGIRRAKEAAVDADLIIFVVDGSADLSAEDAALYSEVAGKNIIIAVNKTDLQTRLTAENTEKFFNAKDVPVLMVSALDISTITPLTNLMKNIIIRNSGKNGLNDILVANLRHKQALILALQSLDSAEAALKKKMSYEFAASDLNSAVIRLSEITGEISNEDVLENIFGKFCIGK
jgi:tRNA modification GTPase